MIVMKRDRKRARDGKRYWAEAARSLGIRETDGMGLRFVKVTDKEKINKEKSKTIS